MFKIQLFFFKIIFAIFKIGYPFGIMKWSNKETYLKIYENTLNKNYPEIDNYEFKFKKKIDIKWFNKLALHTQVVIKKSTINYQHGRILYAELCNYIENNPKSNLIILETGTARGFSSVCMSKAISDCKSVGEINTIDILPNNKKIYWNSISDIDGKKTRPELLQKWNEYTNRIIFHSGDSINVLKKLYLKRVNFAFLDGSHNKKKLEIEFNWVMKRQIKGDIVIFDDYDPYNFIGIYNFVENLEKQKTYKIVKLFSDKNRGYAIAYKL
jgi:hypothetical protein